MCAAVIEAETLLLGEDGVAEQGVGAGISENVLLCSGRCASELGLKRWTTRSSDTYAWQTKQADNLPAPYLKRVWLEPSRVANREAYPFRLPLFHDDSELSFDRRSQSSSAKMVPANPRCWKGSRCSLAMTKPAAARVTCRSTIPGDGGDGRPGLSNRSVQAGCRRLPMAGSSAPRASFPSRRYLDLAARDVGKRGPDFLSHSHGEGFLRFFEERCQHQGIFSSSTSRNSRCHPRARSSFELCGRWTISATARSSWPPIRPC